MKHIKYTLLGIILLLSMSCTSTPRYYLNIPITDTIYTTKKGWYPTSDSTYFKIEVDTIKCNIRIITHTNI